MNNKPFKLVIVSLLAMGLHWSPVVAEQVTIYGDISCEGWLKVRKRRSWRTNVHEWWVSGFVSGLSIARGANVMDSTDIESAYDWIDDYCKNQPAGSVTNATIALYSKLDAQQSAQTSP